MPEIYQLTECNRNLLEPFCGVKLELFKNGVLKQLSFIEFSDGGGEFNHLEKFDRFQVSLYTQQDRVLERLSDDSDVIGESDYEDDDFNA